MATETPTEIDFDPDTMDIDEVELAEEITDIPMDEWGNPGVKKGKIMRAMAFIAMRRTDPNLKIEDVGKVKVKSFKDQSNPLSKPASNGSGGSSRSRTRQDSASRISKV